MYFFRKKMEYQHNEAGRLSGAYGVAYMKDTGHIVDYNH